MDIKVLKQQRENKETNKAKFQQREDSPYYLKIGLNDSGDVSMRERVRVRKREREGE